MAVTHLCTGPPSTVALAGAMRQAGERERRVVGRDARKKGVDD